MMDNARFLHSPRPVLVSMVNLPSRSSMVENRAHPITPTRLLLPRPYDDGHHTRNQRSSGKILPLWKEKPDHFMKVDISIPDSLDVRRDDNPRRNHFRLHFSLSYSLILYHMLYDLGDKRGIWCERDYRRLPYLSADKLQMDINFGRWLLWRPEGARFGYCCLESSPRRGRCGPTHAGTVGITACKGKKGGIDLHVRDRYHVWHPNRPAPNKSK